ncbi:CDP-4-dehydro-6-deoxyglucose reductase [Salinimicrobium sediminis]|uniref:CDP-4-dehydro-6-deoxyglucose reductase n=1 Tax=Salinimicrobium sediminis TaxID=1343891 RepID=A0A285X5P8_9FLAO|nr:FAD-binding oxidoreductase [Salinimicrobium sediminis]SOC80336.1 CDP-4-dehydro-6-deoxyglucose reductase [Salinimicrobium sediminis]
MFKISLRNNRIFNCSSEDNLVEGAKKSGVILEHSCLIGRCSSCKVKVQSGQSFSTSKELGLTSEEIENGYILSCVRSPLTDMVLDTEDLSEYNIPSSRVIPAKIQDIQIIGEEIIKVVLRIPPTQSFKFLNGQYVNIIKGSIKRSYSIANTNADDHSLEFFIKNYIGGEMSQYWFNKAKKNDLLRIEGPKGTFFRRNQNVNNLIFLATGTGIAPVKSIMENLKQTSNLKYNIYLFWGNRYNQDFFWDPKETDIPVKFFPVLSRDKSAMVNNGYVQDILLKQDLDLSKSAVYACGSEKMIKEAEFKLVKRGLPEENFFSDAFVISN